jgi:hypothetical protein
VITYGFTNEAPLSGRLAALEFEDALTIRVADVERIAFHGQSHRMLDLQVNHSLQMDAMSVEDEDLARSMVEYMDVRRFTARINRDLSRLFQDPLLLGVFPKLFYFRAAHIEFPNPMASTLDHVNISRKINGQRARVVETFPHIKELKRIDLEDLNPVVPAIGDQQSPAYWVKDHSTRTAELSGMWSLTAHARSRRGRAVAAVNLRGPVIGQIAEIDAAVRADGHSCNSVRASGSGRTRRLGVLQPGHCGECEQSFAFIQL